MAKVRMRCAFFGTIPDRGVQYLECFWRMAAESQKASSPTLIGPNGRSEHEKVEAILDSTEGNSEEEDAKGVGSPEFKDPSPMIISEPGDQLKPEEAHVAQDPISVNDEASAEFKVPSLSLTRPKNQSKPVSIVENRDMERSTKSSSTEPPPPLPYNEPTWSSIPTNPYVLTVIKNGTIIQTAQLSQKPFHVFGRLPSCEFQLEHPSISRYHAILQYRPHDKQDSDNDPSIDTRNESIISTSVSVNPKEEGFYVYDLGSTHGTFINKTKIQMRCYYRLRLGQMVKFGGSSRLFLLEVRKVGFYVGGVTSL
jgi:pSer/pThr/pTyr-binding forkhead associated (FHA) protein